MAFTFRKTPSGTVEVFENGKRISTTTPENAKSSFGFKDELTLPDTSTQPVDLSLPQDGETQQPAGGLLGFKDTISKISDLARQKKKCNLFYSL